jgi:hypothetical protein
MQNALLNMDLEDNYRKALSELGYALEDLFEEEHDAGLGNGGTNQRLPFSVLVSLCSCLCARVSVLVSLCSCLCARVSVLVSVCSRLHVGVAFGSHYPVAPSFYRPGTTRGVLPRLDGDAGPARVGLRHPLQLRHLPAGDP